MFSLLRECKKKHKMILELARADFRKRFVGSYFGAVWMFIQPLVTIAIYAFIFGPYGFKSSPPVPNVSYTLWNCSLVLFFRNYEYEYRNFTGVSLSGEKGCFPDRTFTDY